MRLAQMARKVGVQPVDVRRYLENEFAIEIGHEPNYKLSDDQIEAVIKAFAVSVKEEIPNTVSSTEKDKSIPDGVKHAEIELTDKEQETLKESAEIAQNLEEEQADNQPVATATDSTEEKEELVQETASPSTDSVDENTEAEIEEEAFEDEETTTTEVATEEEAENEESDFREAEVDPDAELIKAPKVKLDGLKILGKIELPDDKPKEEPEDTAEAEEKDEEDKIAALDAAMASQEQDVKAGKIDQPTPKAVKQHVQDKEEHFSEYKDEKGIYHFSPQQKANREKRLAEIALKKKRKAEKRKKEMHYKKLMEERKTAVPEKVKQKKEKKAANTRKKKELQKQKEEPKSLWKKFLNWLND